MNPGVGEYNIQKATKVIIPKNPKATIGNQSRFAKKCSLNEYIKDIPLAYQDSQTKFISKKGGVIGSESRWSKPPETPGVGQYYISGFKNLAKASETEFEHTTKRKVRAMSAFGGRVKQEDPISNPYKI